MSSIVKQLNNNWQEVAEVDKYVSLQPVGYVEYMLNTTMPATDEFGISSSETVHLRTSTTEKLYVRGDGRCVLLLSDV